MRETATTPKPPYYAVIFTSVRTPVAEGYAETSARMFELAAGQEGFLGVESARDEALGITVSYWTSLEAIRAWKRNAEHRIAQERGRSDWYREYAIRIALVERAYDFSREAP